jgi:hypothetical protein
MVNITWVVPYVDSIKESVTWYHTHVSLLVFIIMSILPEAHWGNLSHLDEAEWWWADELSYCDDGDPAADDDCDDDENSNIGNGSSHSNNSKTSLFVLVSLLISWS